MTEVRAAAPDLAGAGASGASGAAQGPKWETYDGRVRQRIWQHAGLFAPGNRFLVAARQSEKILEKMSTLPAGAIMREAR